MCSGWYISLCGFKGYNYNSHSNLLTFSPRVPIASVWLWIVYMWFICCNLQVPWYCNNHDIKLTNIVILRIVMLPNPTQFQWATFESDIGWRSSNPSDWEVNTSTLSFPTLVHHKALSLLLPTDLFLVESMFIMRKRKCKVQESLANSECPRHIPL